jgi:hypothetical protein
MRTTLCALAALLAGGTALATETLPPQLEPCLSLSRDTERLACYDRAIAAIKSGQAGTPVSAENMFGANSDTAQGSPEIRGVKREELKQISGTVTSLRRTNDGMIVLELDNGQVWRQQDSDVRLMVANGDQVTIVRASMGTFRITDKSGRFARFKRVQ